MDLGNSLETIFIAMTHLNDLKKQRILSLEKEALMSWNSYQWAGQLTDEIFFDNYKLEVNIMH